MTPYDALSQPTHDTLMHTRVATPLMPREKKQTPEALTLIYQCTDWTLSLADV